eukprot:TRINITY_DN26178_c0_g1_i1.p1 TRINITY_DN26178_c0_g1~~TRINITY_DN26178_c0_g1_i1.p1  ORF type:complete len:555 (+),score=116.01 TRINITY_DN26178_c0_g1_i1:37-1701(+)
MIGYSASLFGLLFQARGSVVPRSVVFAVPSTILAGVLQVYLQKDDNLNMSQFASYNFVVGFLLVFRTQIAYSRYWEAATIVQKVRANWFNAVSACFAFCSTDPERKAEVHKFKHCLLRLASLLHCTSLQQIAVMRDEAFEIIDVENFAHESLDFLASSVDKNLIVLQWLQQLIVHNHQSGVLPVPPPILTRAFQELTNGMVGMVDAQKISDILFPFPYAQILSGMLVVYTFTAPALLGTIMHNLGFCLLLNFICVLAFWSLLYIAEEIEMPFGEDHNDLPLAELQQAFNRALITLMDKRFSTCPNFEITDDTDALLTYACPRYLISTEQYELFTKAQSKAEKHGRVQRKLQAAAKPARATIQGATGQSQIALQADAISADAIAISRKSEPPAEMELVENKKLKVPVQLEQVEATAEVPADIRDDKAGLLPEPQPTALQEAPLQKLVSCTSQEIEASLEMLRQRVRKHFSTAVADFDFIAAHQATVNEPSLVKLSTVLDRHLSLMVQELDKIALSSLQSSGRPQMVHISPIISAKVLPIIPGASSDPPQPESCTS